MVMKEKIAILSILANAILAGSKILVGFVSSSSSIIAEGFHSLTDIFSSFIGYFGIRASQKSADSKHPYGHYKFEVFSGAVITIILLVMGVGIIYKAYQGFLNPEQIRIDYLAFLVMFLSVLINAATSKIKIYYGKKENSLTLLSDGTHDKADVLASGAVLVGLFLSRYWIYADSLLAALIGLYIIKESFSLGKEAVDSMLDVSAGEEVEEKIKSIIKKQGIIVDSLKTQKKGSVITANIVIKLPNDLKVEEATKKSDSLREKLTNEINNLAYIAIQIKSHEVETSYYKPSLGRGFGWQRKGKINNTIPAGQNKGPEGRCVCSKCGSEIPHTKGIPCSTLQCSKCKINLERK
jgi:cation diffusion facilitator family transporter